ncbi:MAG TPA: helix-turn-helix domain-containing protein [Dictyobacter sp.]|jgi:AraC-like DNA-binding protein/quercetin dioxygenase-like cupin family protein|nr:helix-turn-helix domain-containing protein [Dictyobacter sp.]
MSVAKAAISQARHQTIKRYIGASQFQLMQEDPQALDRLDIRFRWGRFGIQVLRCHLISFKPGHIIQAHKHCDYEFHFIPGGKGTVVLKNGAFPLHSGVFYLTGPQVVHRQEADQREQLDELCLHVDIVPLSSATQQTINDDSHWGEEWEIGEADQCIHQLNTMPAFPTLDQYDAMNWFLIAYRAWYDHEPGAFSTIRQAVIQILLRAARAHHAAHINTTLPPRDMNAYRYRLATQYIRDNYARSLTLDEVADELHICSRQLQRIFGEQANETFSGYLEHYRLAQVCMALTYADQTIEQLACQHGFSSGSYLHYVFKKRMGITPQHYREQQRVQKSPVREAFT